MKQITKVNPIEWWNGLTEKGKIVAIQTHINESFNDAKEVWDDCQGQVTDDKIKEIYNS